MTAAACSRAASDFDLLSGGSDLLDLALLAARGAAAARRMSEGVATDADDQRSLSALAVLFEQSARAVEAFDPQHSSTPPPTGALAARVDVAIDAVLHASTSAVDLPTANAEGISKLFERLAAEVKVVVSGHEPDRARALVALLDALAASVLRETGHVGEITSPM